MTEISIRDAGPAHLVEPTDGALLSRVRAGGTDGAEAYAELFMRHGRTATAVARCAGCPPCDIEDLVADVFERTLRALRAGGGPRVEFRPYLFVSVRNAVRTHQRNRRRQVTVSPCELAPLLVVADRADRWVEGSAVRAALAALPMRWRHALWLREVEGLDHAAIGSRLDLSANGAAQLLVRARRGLIDAYLAEHLQLARGDAGGAGGHG